MRIAILSDSPALQTGYGQNAANLITELDALGHECVAIGLGHSGEPVRWKGIEIYPASTPFMLQKSIQMFKPEVMMHIRDNWIFIPKYVSQPYTLLPMCRAAKVKLINYTPVQAAPLPPEFIQTIDTQADFTYITNKYGMEWVIKQGDELGLDLKDRVGTLYNGVNPYTFRHMNIAKNPALPQNKKMVSFVGANMDYRKAIPLAMLAFKKYLERRDDAFLYLHTNPLGGFDIPLFIHNLGLQKTCFLKSGEGMKLMTWDLTTEEMAVMYNMSDMFLTCTASEGFNEPLLEALSCGLPAVVTDTPVHREIFSCFGDRVQFIRSTETLPTVWAFEHHADPTHASELIEKALDMGKRPISMAQYPQFSWKKIAQQFVKKAEEIVQMPFEEPKDRPPRRENMKLKPTEAKDEEA